MRLVHFCMFLSCIRTAFTKAISIQIETDDVTQVLSNMKADMSQSKNVNINSKILDQVFQILTAEDQPFFNPYHPEDQSRYRRAKSEKFRSLIRNKVDNNIDKANERYFTNGLNKISEDELTENHDEKISLKGRPNAPKKVVKPSTLMPETQQKRATAEELKLKRRSDALMDFDNDRYFMTGLNKISEDELTENHEECLIPKPVNKGNKSNKDTKQERFKKRNSDEGVTKIANDRNFSTGLKISKDEHAPKGSIILTTERTENNKEKRGESIKNNHFVKRRANGEFSTDKFSNREVLKNPEEIVSSTTKTKDPLINLSQSEADAIEDLYLITQDNIGKKRFNDMKQEGIIYT